MTLLGIFAAAGWILFALVLGLYVSERDRRLHLEGARRHSPHVATVISAPKTPERQLEDEEVEREIQEGIPRLIEQERAKGRVLSYQDARKALQEAITQLDGTG